MSKISEYWEKWTNFIDGAKEDPKTAVKDLVSDNMAVVIPIAGLIVLAVVIKMARRGKR